MPNRLAVLLAAIAPCALAVAQDVAPSERARRVADNPMRLIIEASKVRRRSVEKVAVRQRSAPEAVQTAVVVAPPAAAVGSTASTLSAESTSPFELPASSTAMPDTMDLPPPGEPFATSEPPAASEPTAASEPPAESEPATSAPPSRTEPELPPVGPRAALVADPVIDEPPQPLRAAQIVEPVVPRRLADQVSGDVDVVVAFTVQPDGSVHDAQVQSSTHPLVNETVLRAVAQWRYDAIPAPRRHAVQLRLRSED